MYKSDTKGDLIPVVIFQFHHLPDLWITQGQYESLGGYVGVLKNMSLSVGWIKKVHHLLKNPRKFPENDWEG